MENYIFVQDNQILLFPGSYITKFQRQILEQNQISPSFFSF